MAQEIRKSKKKWAAEPISYHYFTGDYSKILRRLEGAVSLGAAPGPSDGAGKPAPPPRDGLPARATPARRAVG
jgi:hypothetical protein